MIYENQLVSLGPLDSTDNAIIRAWRNDPRIWRFCRQYDLISDADQVRWFKEQSEDPTVQMYMIYSANNQKVGVCGLTSIDRQNRRAEFSLYIEPNMQGAGFGERALRTLLSHGFNSMGLHLIWGETFDGNKAASLFERVGMTKEGTRREFYWRNGAFIDAHLYSMTEGEWRHSASQAAQV